MGVAGNEAAGSGARVRAGCIVAAVAAAISVAAGISARSAAAAGPDPAASRTDVVVPPPNVAADYQLGGAYPPAPGVVLVARDRTEPPAPGAYGICYVNAFQTQPGAIRWWRSRHPRLLLRDDDGRLVRDPGWPDEVLLDTSTAWRRRALARIVGSWTDGCARSGYLAVEPDNLDSWTRSDGRLTRAGNADLARRIVARAHAAGLAVAQKNDVAMLALRGRIGFDFAVAEDCEAYDECEAFIDVYGDHVIEVEYVDGAGAAGFRAACTARGGTITIVYRDRTLGRPGDPGYAYDSC